MDVQGEGDGTIAAASSRRTLRERLSMPAWSLYDFSDTIFSASILTFFFPLWVAEDMKSAGGSSAVFAITLSMSALLVALTAPAMGTVSDRLNRRIPMLAVCLLSCASLTAVIGLFGGLTTGLALFFIANYLYQTGLIFYNSLIINVSSEETRGIVSGIGIGAGYVGLFVAFLLFEPQVEKYGNQWAFLPTAGMYVLFALPLLLVLKEGGAMRRLDKSLVIESYRQLYGTFQRARAHVNLFRFIIARFAYTEAINTVSSFYVLYLVEIGVATDNEAVNFVTTLLLVAVAASIAVGFLVSRFGPKRVLMVGIAGWTVVVLGVSLVVGVAFIGVNLTIFGLSLPATLWAVGLLGGLAWASPQIADRVLLTKLAPDGQVGEFFGLFQMSGRLSAALGPALWWLITTVFISLGAVRFRIAMSLLAVFLIVGFLILLWVREQREESDLSDADEQAPAPQVVD